MSTASESSNGEEYVILAEDSAPNRAILALLLRKMNFQVIECEDGQIAWDKMHQNRDKNIVAVISDMMMPNMDGLGLLRRVRGDEQFSQLPFVFVTAISEKDYVFEAKNLHANGYILKPVTFKRVAQKIQDIFPGKKLPQLAG